MKKRIVSCAAAIGMLSCLALQPVPAEARTFAEQDPRIQVVECTNKERLKEGLSLLSTNRYFNSLGDIRAKEVYTLFSHTRPDGSKWNTVFYRDNQVDYVYSAENIAKIYPNAERVVDGWMNSPGHRANILNPVYNHLCAGYYCYDDWNYWSQNFLAGAFGDSIYGSSECQVEKNISKLIEDVDEGKGIYRIGITVEEMPLFLETSCAHGKSYIPVISELTTGFDSSKGRHKFTVNVGGKKFEMTANFRHPFTDVGNEWYTEYICRAYESGVMTGKSASRFCPKTSLTRGEFATTLYRINGTKEYEYRNVFPDVKSGAFYSKAVVWAADTGVVTGYNDGTFAPAMCVTREQIATMLYRYAKMKGYPVSGAVSLSGYKDKGTVSSFAKEAMQWAVGNGIITGKENGTKLDPRGNASRAETATILVRFTEKYR